MHENVLLLIPLLVGLGGCQVHFDCPQLPPLSKPAENVYELRPQDIKVVMALGDSITAGFGMNGSHGNLIEDLQEYRGQSWSIGGDPGAQTVATFLRFYTPNIVGASLGKHFFEVCYGIICPPFQYEPDKDVFNAAQSGAMAPNLVTHEFSYLLDQLKHHPEVDMQNDWKLLTILIGANDLCLGCSGDFPFLTAEDYEYHLRETLEEIRKNIPRVFVNLVLVGNLSEIYKLSLKSQHCVDVHRLLPIECVCAFLQGEEGDKLRLELDILAQQYNDRTRKVALEYAQKKYDDFAAIVQPFFSNAKSDNFTVDFLSDLDCFHPSTLAHQNMGKALWNNMLTPAARKRTSFDFTETFVAQDYAEARYSDFAVVVHHFTIETTVENLAIDILSDLDYFHPSLIGHQHMAKALWNSMLTPATNKKTYFNADEPFCVP